MATRVRNEVLRRVYVITGLLVLFGLIILIKAFRLSVLEADAWRALVENRIETKKIEGYRGSILASDGSLLATSMPYYDIRFDATVPSKEDLDRYLDSLSYFLATFVDTTYTPGGYKEFLLKQVDEEKAYVKIKDKVPFREMKAIKNFPLFRLGRFKGGLIVEVHEDRQRPFGLLAHRTIGYVREGAKPVGLEGAFDSVLRGDSIVQPVINMPNHKQQPVKELSEIQPASGDDLLTTIDIDIQEIAERSLYQALEKHEAEYGTAIVMEVETGAIRAIANLGRTKKGKLWEIYNYGVGYATEPGSTFKLATIMALLEKTNLDLADSIDLEQGRTEFVFTDSRGRKERVPMRDASAHGKDSTNIETAFVISSNVGMAKMMDQYFVQPGKLGDYLRALKKFHLDQPTGIEIPGEPRPLIKSPQDDDWSGTTPLWMATGYEVRITPLQLLTFYNAVANDGRMMKPYLVEEIRHYGFPVKKFHPKILDKRIASPKTLAKAQYLLEQVVEKGTARSGRSDRYHFAGKTGTAQLDYGKRGRKKVVGGHQASFVGYFPAKDPKYSCIVVIGKPKKGGYYGSVVALPVFRKIADGIYDLRPEVHEPLKRKDPVASRWLPKGRKGNARDMRYFLPDWGLPVEDLSGQSELAILAAYPADTLQLKPYKLPESRVVPNVTGMGLRDAVYELEKRGLTVKLRDYRPGRVVMQSIKPGTPLHNQTITLVLK